MRRLVIGVVFLAAALSCGPARSRPVLSNPLSGTTTPQVTLATVDLFIRLTPLVRSIEDDEWTTLEEIHRSRHVRRQKRLEFRLHDLHRRLAEQTGVPVEDYLRLKWAIMDIHKTIFAIRSLREERRKLLETWQIQLAHDTAPDEVFVARRQHIDDHIAHLEEILKESASDEARIAVDTRFDRILAAFKRPPKPSRFEEREARERANELLPPAPANPYRQGFFDDFY
jgi:hypothetical protein